MPRPLLISTWSFARRAHDAAWPILEAGGSSLDAVERAAIAVEEDPEVDSVGYGGLPDLGGEVSLDASIMLSPARCGSVCAVRNYLHVTTLARMVMEKTDHHMLAGEGAERFAAQCGLEKRTLLSEGAARTYAAWLSGVDASFDESRDRSLRPVDRGDSGGQLFHAPDRHGSSEVDEARWRGAHDTIGTIAIDREGGMAGACSTSGSAYKLPGRVGDSPIIGAGLYVDPEAGAAVATGTGELMMGTCAAFLIVERMRGGESPAAAIRFALERIAKVRAIRPRHQAAFIAVRPDGAVGSGALRRGFRVAIREEGGGQIVEPDFTLRDD